MSGRLALTVYILLLSTQLLSGQELITNVDHRQTVSLNGSWNVIVDPYNNGYYGPEHKDSFFQNRKPSDKTEKVEFSFDNDHLLQVPGDWNTQEEQLLLYEGTVWYHRKFDYSLNPGKRVFLYFGAANYHTIASINTHIIGEHIGGFTPFNFEVTDYVREKDNFVIVKVDNKRIIEGIPTIDTDWHNYGGLTRRAILIETPETFIRDYKVQLGKGEKNRIRGWVQLDGSQASQKITIRIPEAKIKKTVTTDSQGYADFDFSAKLTLWSPETPKLYDVEIESETDKITDRIGFRTIETKGTDILLNGKPQFLRGVCIHEEAPYNDGGRAYSADHARILLGWAKDMGCNFVRLAHYPHNENMTRMADEMGIMVWSEVPVYWKILWDNEETYKNAANQVRENITRDKNKASIILWSVANETPAIPERTEFLGNLAETVRNLDDTRLITAALFKDNLSDTTLKIIDPLGEHLDVIGCNAYLGWYEGLPDKCDRMIWQSAYDKPVIISEFGGGALYGMHGDSLTRWSEEYQANLYRHNLAMFDKVQFIKGMTPWILKDFRSPRRLLPRIQDMWNRKGLVSDRGERKQAFDVLHDYYESKK